MVKLTFNSSIAELEIDNGENNFLTSDLLRDLQSKLKTCLENDAIKVLILKGNGKCFCGGGDHETVLKHADGIYDEKELSFPLIVSEFPLPVIAAVEGHAIGGGFTLALSCDLLLLAKESSYGFPFIQFGFPIHNGVLNLSQYYFGPLLTNLLCLTGQLKRGQWFAEAPGVLVYPKDNVLAEARKLAFDMADLERKDLITYKTFLNEKKNRLLKEAFAAEKLMAQAMAPTVEVKAQISEYFNAYKKE